MKGLGSVSGFSEGKSFKMNGSHTNAEHFAPIFRKPELNTEIGVKIASNTIDSGLVRRKLSNPKNSKVYKSGNQPLQCKFCNKLCSNHSALKYHQHTHTGEKTLQCKFCDKKFTHPTTLKRHNLTHTGEESFNCRYCQRNFKYAQHLKVHERGHTGENPYKCKFCTKTFRLRRSLNQHKCKPISSYKNQKCLICKFCDKTFLCPSKLERHERIHTGEFKCTICNETFADSLSCQMHCLKQHGNKDHEVGIDNHNFDENIQNYPPFELNRNFVPTTLIDKNTTGFATIVTEVETTNELYNELNHEIFIKEEFESIGDGFDSTLANAT